VSGGPGLEHTEGLAMINYKACQGRFKISSGELLMTAESIQIIIWKIKVFKEGSKRAGETYRKPIAYFTTLEAALLRLFDLGVCHSDATTIKELLKVTKQVREDIRRVGKQIGSTWRPLREWDNVMR